jgi:hypothetical protein
VYFQRYSPIIVCVIALIMRGSVLEDKPCGIIPGLRLNRVSTSEANEERDEALDLLFRVGGDFTSVVEEDCTALGVGVPLKEEGLWGA